MNIFTYTVYLKSGNIAVMVADSSIRDYESTELYKHDNKGKKHLVARFENDAIEGMVIKRSESE